MSEERTSVRDILGERRAGARRLALDTPLPGRSTHRFRYTDARSLVPGGEVAAAWLDAEDAAPVVTFEVPAAAREAGVRAMTLDEAAREVPELLAEHLDRIADPGEPLLAPGFATVFSGAVVVVPKGAAVDEPVYVRIASQGPADRLASVRVLVVAGPDSRARVIEEAHASSGFLHVVSEAFVGAGAALTHGRYASCDRGATGFSHAAWIVGRDANLTHFDVVLARGVWKSEAVPRLAGSGASATGLGLAMPGPRGCADLRFVEDHAAPDSTSRVTFRAVAGGRGRAVFTGLLRIRPDAVRAEAFEEARGLLLSSSAHADVLPELEILNHDVRCSHGAAVGPVDEDAVFYLTSRGLDRTEAEALLVEGFVEPIAGALPEALAVAVRERVREAITPA